MAKKKKKNNKKKNQSLFRQAVKLFIIISALVSLVVVFIAYRIVLYSNVSVNDKQYEFIFIPTGSELSDVTKILYEKNYIKNKKTFEWMLEKKNYKNHIKPGRYKLENGMSNNDLINRLRSGEQELVKLVFNNIRYKQDLASRISSQIEPDSIEILMLLNNQLFLSSYGFDKNNVLCMFIPNTYEFYWSTNERDFFSRMYKEYQMFWNENRMQKAKELNMTPIEVSILASILEEETRKNDEKDIIAGVYINRLKKGVKLQADPTVKYALNDFSVKRVLLKYLDIDSRYNTYKYKGLPPGPICLPSISSIDAVLNYKKHKYMYFCAKSDFSGYHVFANTYTQHIANAREYQNALNERNIK